MSKFKIGDKVVGAELRNEYGTPYLHNYLSVGRVYTILGVSGTLVSIIDDYGVTNAWTQDWFELYEEKEKEMNVEQMRDEVVRIDKRIEEANKDIANAQKEREALVENIREKGFVLADETAFPVGEDSVLKVGDFVIITGYSPHRHNSNYTGYIGFIREIDGAGIPYRVEISVGHTEWFDASQVKKFKQ